MNVTTNPPPAVRFQPGESVGDYVILAPLGRGGMGRLFRVKHMVTGQTEVLKVMAEGLKQTPEMKQRFLREVQVQASLNHPNIAAVHNAFWHDSDLVLIIELIDGESLDQLIREARVPLNTAIDYACQVLSALHYAHENGIVHRDVTPANVLVSPNGTLKLTDFGLARQRKDIRLTSAGTPIGSLHYTSPEQIRGLEVPDARSDIYSVGVVLYEMLTGRKPFEAPDSFSLMRMHVEDPPAPPTAFAPETPAELEAIVLRALDKNPEARFPTAREFRSSLLEFWAKLQATPKQAAPVVEAKPQGFLRHKRALVGGVIFGLLLAVGFFLVRQPQHRAAPAPAPPPVAKVEPPPPPPPPKVEAIVPPPALTPEVLPPIRPVSSPRRSGRSRSVETAKAAPVVHGAKTTEPVTLPPPPTAPVVRLPQPDFVPPAEPPTELAPPSASGGQEISPAGDKPEKGKFWKSIGRALRFRKIPKEPAKAQP